jgi:hypothetical protein
MLTPDPVDSRHFPFFALIRSCQPLLTGRAAFLFAGSRYADAGAFLERSACARQLVIIIVIDDIGLKPFLVYGSSTSPQLLACEKLIGEG